MHLLVTWKTPYGLKFHIFQINRSEICPEFHSTWTRVTVNNEAALHQSEVLSLSKFQTDFSSLRVLCQRVHRLASKNRITHFCYVQLQEFQCLESQEWLDLLLSSVYSC